MSELDVAPIKTSSDIVARKSNLVLRIFVGLVRRTVALVESLPNLKS
jgi:hypothetical protein